MKLTNQQVKVLAEDILEGLTTEANKYKESPEYINFEATLKNDVIYKAHVSLEKSIKVASELGVFELSDWHVRNVLDYKKDYVNTQRNLAFPKPKLPTQQAIENKIILNTIEVDNLDDLITKVKESFNK